MSQICDDWCLKKFYFNDGLIFSELHQDEFSISNFFDNKFCIMVDFQRGQNCLRNSPKCFLKRHLFLENTKLLVSNRYMTLTHFKTKCCLDDDKPSIFDVEIGNIEAFQAWFPVKFWGVSNSSFWIVFAQAVLFYVLYK